MPDSIADRVQRGVAWLDANGPADWPERVDLTDLQMSDPCRCVLGWTFKDEAADHDNRFGEFYGYYYGWALAADLKGVGINAASSWPTEHGFDSDRGVSGSDLQDAWTAVITERRAVSP